MEHQKEGLGYNRGNRGAKQNPAGRYWQNLPKLIINSYLQESKQLVCVCDRYELLAKFVFIFSTKVSQFSTSSTVFLVKSKLRTLELLAVDK